MSLLSPLSRRGAAVRMAALAVLPAGAWAQPRPQRLVVPAPPGGNLDAGARLMAQHLSRLTGQAWLVENRPGANTQIGAELVARADADGRTLLFAGTGLMLLPYLQKTSFSPRQELAPVAQVSVDHYVLVSRPGGPLAQAQDLAALAAGRPLGLDCAAAPGVSALACEQIKLRLGGRVATVPFAGIGPALNAVMGGHADFMFVNLEPVFRLLKSDRLTLLAQTPGAEAATGRQVPTLPELWPGFVSHGYTAIYAPAGTPESRILQINRDINRVLAEPEVRAALREGGQQPAGGSPQRLEAANRETVALYGGLIERLGLTPR